MRLVVYLTIDIICILLMGTGTGNAQKYDSAYSYSNSWAKLYNIIDSSFINRTDTSIKEQTAIVQFQLIDGKIDTFYIWSTYEKKVSNWIVPFVKPAIGHYFGGYKGYKYVIVPIRIVDYKIHGENDKVSADQTFIFEFVGAFKNVLKDNITIARGLLLERPWPDIK